MVNQRVVVLAGGVGAARFLQGVVAVTSPEDVTVISNVGDDDEIYGVHVSPDIDIVIYTLAGVVDQAKGFGLTDDTFAVVGALGRFGADAWFGLGDRDFATCLYRTLQLRAGRPLSEITTAIVRSFGLDLTLLPVTDARLATRVRTPAGTLAFQDYFVRRRTEDEVLGIDFEGADRASPAPGVLDAISRAGAILIAPSNPFVSIGPILSVSGVRDAIVASGAPVVAVSPIVGGEALKGPAAKMFRSLGGEASAAGVAVQYQGLVDALVIDTVDTTHADAVAALGITPVIADTIMRGPVEKANLARIALDAARSIAASRTAPAGAGGQAGTSDLP
ncbi:MAG: 2-phospho-L-lactate transferase [Dehalococcoidia bacterium]